MKGTTWNFTGSARIVDERHHPTSFASVSVRPLAGTILAFPGTFLGYGAVVFDRGFPGVAAGQTSTYRNLVGAMSINFLSMMVEALPFMLIGSLVGGVIEVFMPVAWVERVFQRRHLGGIGRWSHGTGGSGL